MTTSCCAECGKEEEGGGVLKACKACMSVKYCNAECQLNHWATHKKQCKLRAAELRDEALFNKEPPPKEDCPICFLPMSVNIFMCTSLPPATILSVPIYDFAMEHKEFAYRAMEQYHSCCGKNICGGCRYSFFMSGNHEKCPFCNADQADKTDEEHVEQMRKRVDANDPDSIVVLACSYFEGRLGLQQNHTKATKLYAKAADLGSSKAHFALGNIYHKGGYMKKAKFHFEAAAMAGDVAARNKLGNMEEESGNMKRAFKHWIIAASAGNFHAMNTLRVSFKEGAISKESINSTLTAYNNSCAEMRSEARDAFIRAITTVTV
jgi:tetratricopeptide (TPR) repeat protein